MRPAAALWLLLAACSAGAPVTVGGGRSSGSEYQPLEIGWRWIYEIEGGGICTRVVTGRQNVGRFDCRVVEETVGDASVRWWLRSDRDGLKLYRYADGGARQDLDDAAIWFKYPPVRGQRWEYETSHGAVDIQCTGIYEDDERVKVPAGEFACARVRTLGFCDGRLILEKVEWYAKGIGLVRQSVSYSDEQQARSASMSLKEISR